MTVMTIIGLGLDVTEISRIQYMLDRYGARFHDRIYTPGEVAYCQRRRDQASSFAARFAAKEASMKALGTGRSRGVLWRDVEVVRTFGPPQLRFHGGAARRFAEMNGSSAFLTLTHAGELAIAQVILVGA
jgi:holo-[acyl-carrier protein] synthase